MNDAALAIDSGKRRCSLFGVLLWIYERRDSGIMGEGEGEGEEEKRALVLNSI